MLASNYVDLGLFFSNLESCSLKWNGGLLEAVGMGKMLLCVTWLVSGQDGMPFRINCEDELDYFSGSREGWDGCNTGLRNARH